MSPSCRWLSDEYFIVSRRAVNIGSIASRIPLSLEGGREVMTLAQRFNNLGCHEGHNLLLNTSKKSGLFVMPTKEQVVVDARTKGREHREHQKIVATNKKAQKQKPTKSEISTLDKASSSTTKGSKKKKQTSIPTLQVPTPEKEDEGIDVSEDVTS
eukprot:Gb_14308 [translate_table: standard]